MLFSRGNITRDMLGEGILHIGKGKIYKKGILKEIIT